MTIDGKPFDGWLSRNPTTRGEKRRLILVTIALDEVPEEYRADFARFLDRICSLEPRATAAAKRAVVNIVDGVWVDDRYGVVVHKMGPVPAFLLKDVRFRIPGADGLATVALYPVDLGESRNRGHEPTVALDLFAALTKTDTRQVLMTYFEDIFEHFGDIADKLGIVDCVHRIRAIRDALGRSIGEKLENLTPSVASWLRYRDYQQKQKRNEWPLSDPPPLSEHERRVCQWFSVHYNLIGEAIFLVCVIDACIGEFFNLVGLQLQQRGVAAEVRDVRYDAAASSIGIFCRSYDLDESVFENAPLVSTVGRLLQAFEGGGDDLTSVDAPDAITENLRDFLSFVRVAQTELHRIYSEPGLVSRKPILFISRREESRFGTMAAEVFADVVAIALGPDASLVTTFEGTGGEPLEESVKAQIWLCDTLLSLFPESDEPVGDNVNWICREAEHATLLGKPWTTVARNQLDFVEIQKRLAAVKLPPLAKRVGEARTILRLHTLRRFADDVAIIAGGRDNLTKRLAANVAGLRDSIARSRRMSLLASYFRMFTDDDIVVFSLLNKAFRRETGSFALVTFTRAQFEAKVRGKVKGEDIYLRKNAFAYAHDRAKRLAVLVNHEFVAILRKEDRKKTYVYNIDRIARGFTGDVDVSEMVIAADVTASLKQALDERAASWRGKPRHQSERKSLK